MKTAWNIFWRIAGFPFVLALILTAATRDVLMLSFLWLRYGGEMIAHRKKQNVKGIADVYRQVEKHFETTDNKPKP